MSPAPWRLTLVACPDECNLACDMCREHAPAAPPRPAPPRRLSLDLAVRLLDELHGSRLREVIPSTVGEPLLWRELPGLVGLCAARGLRLNVTTNGTWPRLGGDGWGRLLAGACSDVKVSWNGITATTAEGIMGGLRYEEALAGLRAFLGVRDRRRARGEEACTVTFQVTARERNVAELPEVVRLAARLGVERVKVNQLQVHFPELAAEDLRRSPEARARWSDAVRGMRAAAGEARLPAGGAVRLQGAEDLPEGSEPEPGPCPFLGEEAWVLADGRFAPCPAPAAKEGRLGEFPSLAGRAFAEAWESPGYRALVAGHRGHPACRDCALRRPGGR
jgi:MoaA/NifB/PqqE/SkfB family radical SAM enzyme